MAWQRALFQHPCFLTACQETWSEVSFCVLATNVRKDSGLRLVELRENQKEVTLSPAPGGVLHAFGLRSKVCSVCLARNPPLAPLQARHLNQPPRARLRWPRVAVQTSPVPPLTVHPSVDWQRGTGFETKEIGGATRRHISRERTPVGSLCLL